MATREVATTLDLTLWRRLQLRALAGAKHVQPSPTAVRGPRPSANTGLTSNHADVPIRAAGHGIPLPLLFTGGLIRRGSEGPWLIARLIELSQQFVAALRGDRPGTAPFQARPSAWNGTSRLPSAPTKPSAHQCTSSQETDSDGENCDKAKAKASRQGAIPAAALFPRELSSSWRIGPLRRARDGPERRGWPRATALRSTAAHPWVASVLARILFGALAAAFQPGGSGRQQTFNEFEACERADHQCFAGGNKADRQTGSAGTAQGHAARGALAASLVTPRGEAAALA